LIETTRQERDRRFDGSTVLVILAVAALYLIFAKIGLALAISARQVTAVWPPSGFALAAVLLLGRRSAPGILLGAFLANATAGEPLWVAGAIALGNTLEAMIGALLLQRIGFDPGLRRERDVVALIAVVAVSPVVAASIGVMSLGAGGVQPAAALPDLWVLWWLGDALGGLIFAPVILVMKNRAELPRNVLGEATLLLAGLLIASLVIFVGVARVPISAYGVFPFLIWAGLRFGPLGAATSAALANAIAVWGTHLGHGPFAGNGPEHGLVHLQVFMAVAAATGLFLGAVAAQNRQAQQRAQQKAEEMADADRRKDEFLAMLGHELRNPLAPIVHAVELLGRRDPTLVERGREIIRRQAEHLNRLVGDLLDVSRITRGTVRLERKRVILAEVVGAAADMWRHLIAQKRQQLSVNLPDRPIWLYVDPTRFTQIIANLLHNAAKFTPNEGQIVIDAEEQRGWLSIRIRDTGEGMSRDLVTHVFDLFVQGPRSLDRPKGGLGLGLTLVRRLVDLHGGTIVAKSDGSDCGSEFTVRVPVAEALSEAPVRAPETAAPASLRSRRVLVVEDNDDAREAMTLLLREEGHDVRAASDGLRALAEVQDFTPDVVLLDIGLPGLDGYAVARKLRALPQTAGAMLVAITGYGQAEDRALSRDAGFDYHLLKPVEPLHLIELLR
jgi:signal transduction histidine kinase